jgi:hypothetical protein
MTPILCNGLHVMEVGHRRYLVLVMDEADDAGRSAWYELTKAHQKDTERVPVRDTAPSSSGRRQAPGPP